MITGETIPSVQPYVEAYLRERPLFFSLIRPQEAALFRAFGAFIRRPLLDVGAGDGFFARLTFGNIAVLRGHVSYLSEAMGQQSPTCKLAGQLIPDCHVVALIERNDPHS